MNGYDLTASLIASFASVLASLAWPAAMVGCVYLFRMELLRLLPFLHIKHKETEVSFRLDQAEQAAKNLPEPVPVNPRNEPEAISTQSKLDRLIELSPRAAILDQRVEVELLIRELARSKGVRDDRPIANIIRELRSKEVITYEQAQMMDDIRVIGNSVAHEQTAVDTEDAERFTKLTKALVGFLAGALTGLI